jgi:hypothetical protein
VGAAEGANQDLIAFARGHSGAVASIHSAVLAAIEADGFDASSIQVVTRNGRDARARRVAWRCSSATGIPRRRLGTVSSSSRVIRRAIEQARRSRPARSVGAAILCSGRPAS